MIRTAVVLDVPTADKKTATPASAVLFGWDAYRAPPEDTAELATNVNRSFIPKGRSDKSIAPLFPPHVLPFNITRPFAAKEEKPYSPLH